MKKIFSIRSNSESSIEESEQTVVLESLKKSLIQCEAMRKKAEEKLDSISSDYKKIEHELKETAELKNKFQTENTSLRQEVHDLSTQCRTLANELENLRQKNEDDNNRFIRAIIDCLQNSSVIDSDSEEKSQIREYFNRQLIRILSDMDVTTIEDFGIPANPIFHRIESIIDTDKVEQSGLIAQSLGKGFKRGNVCIVEQPVAVYKNIK